MNPEIIKEKLLKDEIVLIDVREKYEWDEGYIEGAINIPLGEIDNERVKEIPKNKNVYLYCRSGGRAEIANQLFQKMGFLNVVNMGGIIDWQRNGGKLI